MRPAPAAVGQRALSLRRRRRQTPVFDRPDGSVAYDSNFTETAPSSEYHSVKRVTFDADAPCRCCHRRRVKAGYSHLGSDYTHRIWETTDEDVFRVSLDITGNQRFMRARHV